MRVLVASVLVCLAVISTPALAQSPEPLVQAQDKPSEESIRNLLEVMQAKKILLAMTEQLDSTYNSVLSKQLDGQDLTAEQQQALAARRKAARDMVHEMLNPQSMESLYLKVYSESFSQSEVDAMTAFYSSPAGQAVIAKMPLVAKNTMAEMQVRMREMIPKIEQMAKETAAQVKAQGGPKKSG